MDIPALRTWLTGILVGGLALTACTGPVPEPTSSVTQTPATTRPFTVVTSQKVTTTDPAGITTDAATIVALNVYQRLMLVQPGTGALKPDGATDCLFNSPTVYECTLPKDLTFSNGHALTSSDVKFSLLRALRMDVAGTSAGLLGSLSRIDTPAPDIVRFRLHWADRQFGYALATPAASIVDEEAYDSDSLKPADQIPVGSGPYRLDLLDVDGLTFARRVDYKGPNRGSVELIRLAYVADSAAAEEAIATNRAEVVWRTLDDPALARLKAEIEAGSTGTTEQGFKPWALTAARVHRLVWNADSPLRRNATLRRGIALALQADRTLDSVIPVKVDGRVKSFPTGGKPKIPSVSSRRITITLGYLSTSPGHADLARQVRDRLEDALGISVHVVRNSDADLQLTDRPAWVNTAFGWLQEYLTEPLPGSAAKLEDLEQRARTSSDPEARLDALGEIQKQAAADATVIPLAQNDVILYLGEKVSLFGETFGPGWQLGLWGLQWQS